MTEPRSEGEGPERGLLMVITGNGKGKTTAAFGLALRAAGHGIRVIIIQFMKGSRNYGEYIAAHKYLGDLVTVEQYGRDEFVRKGNPLAVDVQHARDGWARAQAVLAGGEFGLVILDEINVAMDFGLLAWGEVEEALAQRNPSADVLLTGRYAPAALIRMADQVSEILDIKHHFADGTQARQGVEY